MKFRLTKDLITPSLEKKIPELKDLPKKAYTFFQQHTPIKTGNARNKTRLRQQTIVAGYPYARNLDQGSSRQAPDGMSKPTRAYVQKEANRILKRK